MNGKKHILMIGGGLQEVEAVRQLKAAGWTVGVSDRDSDCPCANIADYVLEADGRDPERILQELLIRTPDNLPRVVFTLTELTTTVAILLHALKLPAPSILSVVVSQSKALSKDCWLRKGVRTPNGVVVSDAQGLASIPTRSAPPYVIKPDVSSGGRGVVLVKSADKLSEAVRNAIDCSANSRCVVEEYIHGTIHDGNAYFSNGIFVPLSISDRFTGDSIAVESGAICPSCLPPNKQKDFFFLFEAVFTVFVFFTLDFMTAFFNTFFCTTFSLTVSIIFLDVDCGTKALFLVVISFDAWNAASLVSAFSDTGISIFGFSTFLFIRGITN